MAALDGSGVVGERQLRRRRPPLPAPSAVLADEDERGGQGGGGRGEEDELSHLQAAAHHGVADGFGCVAVN